MTRAGYLDALQVRDFRLLWSGQATSAVGDQIFPIATALAVTRSGGGAAALGLVLSARWVALIVCLPFGGVWADRIPPRLVMIAADSFRLLLLAACVSRILSTWALLAVMVLLMGIGEGAFRPAAGSLLPAVLPSTVRVPGNALTSATNRIAGIVGPGLAGAIGASVGPRALYLIDAATFVVSVATLCALRSAVRPRPRHRSVFAEMREGLQEVRRHRWVAPMLVVSSLKMLFVVAPTVILLPILCVARFHSYAPYGWANAALAAGALAGIQLAAHIRPRSPGTVTMLLFLTYAAVPASLAWAHAAAVLVVCYFAAGFGLEPVGIFWQVALQNAIPPQRMARVSSLDWMASFASLPLGMAVLGPVIELVGQGPVLMVALVVSTVPNLLALLIPEVRTLSDHPAGAAETADIDEAAEV